MKYYDLFNFTRIRWSWAHRNNHIFS